MTAPFAHLAKRWLMALLILLGLLFSLSHLAQAQRTARLSPDRITAQLEPGQCQPESLTFQAGDPAAQALDVALVIDLTQSMADEIDVVTRQSQQIIQDVHTLAPDSAFALGSLADYPAGHWLLPLMGEFSRHKDYPWRLNQDITQNPARMEKALNKLTLLDGGDDPESYLPALYNTRHISWRNEARRIVILFGDASPHPLDPGADGISGTADDLTLARVIAALNEAQISVLSVYSDPDHAEFYQSLAQQTGGQAFELSQAEDIPQAIQALLSDTLSQISVLTLESDTPWIRWTPEHYTAVLPQENRDFALTLCAPGNASGGQHQFSLAVLGDQAMLGQIPVEVSIAGPQSNALPWWVWLWPLLLLPLLGWWLWTRQTLRQALPALRPNARPHLASNATPPSTRPEKPAPCGADLQHGQTPPPRRPTSPFQPPQDDSTP